MQRFGEKLRTLRKQRGMTQRELADALGFAAQSFVNALETGKKQPSVEHALMIADLFGISLDRLLRDELELDE